MYRYTYIRMCVYTKSRQEKHTFASICRKLLSFSYLHAYALVIKVLYSTMMNLEL